MAKKQVTFADIAEYTGFSKTTISRYFNHPDSLTLENQEKIAKALDELGYRKNKLARVLANGKSEFVGIIVPNLYLHYYSEMLTQLLRSYSDYHYKFLVFVSALVICLQHLVQQVLAICSMQWAAGCQFFGSWLCCHV